MARGQLGRGRGDGPGGLDAVVAEHGDRLVRFAAVVDGGTGDAVARTADAVAEELRHARAVAQPAIARDGHLVHTDDPYEAVADAARSRLLHAAEPETADAAPTSTPDTVLGGLDPTARALLLLRAEDGYDAFRSAAALGLDPADVRDRLAAVDADLRVRRKTPAAVLAEAPGVGTDGLAEAVRSRLAAAAERARRARRRTAVAVGAAVGVALVGLGGAALAGQGNTHGGAPAPVPSPSQRYIGYAQISDSAPVVCGRTVEQDPAVPVPLTVSSLTPRIVDGGTWWGAYGLDDDALTPEQRGLADPADLTVVPVLTNGTTVVGVADPEADEQALTIDPTTGTVRSGAGFVLSTPSATPTGPSVIDAPGLGDGGSVQATFRSCGVALGAGDYDVQVVAYTADHRHWLVSPGVGVSVLDPLPSGYQPEWLEGSALACRERVEDLQARVETRALTAFDTRTVVFESDGMSYRYVNEGPTADLTVPRRMAVAWVRDGVVVSVGAAEQGTAVSSVRHGGTVRLATGRWDTTDYCRPAADGTFSRRLPAGRYQVVAYARFFPAAPAEVAADGAVAGSSDAGAAGPTDAAAGGWVVEQSGPVSVTVDAHGTASVD